MLTRYTGGGYEANICSPVPEHQEPDKKLSLYNLRQSRLSSPSSVSTKPKDKENWQKK